MPLVANTILELFGNFLVSQITSGKYRQTTQSKLKGLCWLCVCHPRSESLIMAKLSGSAKKRAFRARQQGLATGSHFA
jgi:hypothetical protein